MGYSIYIEFNSIEWRDKIMSFLEKHYQSWATINKEKEDVRGPVIDVSYADEKHECHIGFDYRCQGDPDVWFSYISLYFIARKLQIDHIWYDGCEKFTLKDVDDIGFKSFKKTTFHFFDNADNVDKIGREELLRLNNLWEKEEWI